MSKNKRYKGRVKKYAKGGEYEKFFENDDTEYSPYVDTAFSITGQFTPTKGLIGRSGEMAGQLVKQSIGENTKEGNILGDTIEYGAKGAEIGNLAGPIGTVVGAGVGATYGGISSAINYEANKSRAESRLNKFYANKKSIGTKEAIDNQTVFEREDKSSVYRLGGKKKKPFSGMYYDRDGNTITLAKHGGNVVEAEGGEVFEGNRPEVKSGGKVKKLDENLYLIQGKSHENGGVKMKTSDGFFFSDDWSMKIGSKTPAQLVKENPLYAPVIAAIQEKSKDLTRPQMNWTGKTKKYGGYTKYLEGGEIANYGNQALPYLTTLVNMTRKLPDIPEPQLYSPVKLPRVNFTDQLVEADRQRSFTNKAIGRSTLNSNTANSLRLGTLSDTIAAKNSILGNQTRTNQGISSQETLTNAQIDQANRDKIQGYQSDLFRRKVSQQNRTESGLNQIASTSMMQGAERNAMERDALDFTTRMQAYANSGVAVRNLEPQIKQYLRRTGWSNAKINSFVQGLYDSQTNSYNQGNPGGEAFYPQGIAKGRILDDYRYGGKVKKYMKSC